MGHGHVFPSSWLPPLAKFHHETHLWAARPWRCLELEILWRSLKDGNEQKCGFTQNTLVEPTWYLDLIIHVCFETIIILFHLPRNTMKETCPNALETRTPQHHHFCVFASHFVRTQVANLLAAKTWVGLAQRQHWMICMLSGYWFSMINFTCMRKC